MNGARRTLYVILRIGIFAAALGLVASHASAAFTPFSQDTAIALVASLALLIILLRTSVPMLSLAYAHRRHVEPGRLTLELPVMIAVFSMYGPVAAAVLALLAYPLAVPAEGRSRLLRRVLDGGAAALLWLAVGAIRPHPLDALRHFSLNEFFAFLGFYAAVFFGFLFFIWVPLKSLAQRTLPLLALWNNLIRDTRLFAYAGLTISWAYVGCEIWLRAGLALGLASFLPLPFIATALKIVHHYRLELHRLRIARDAVQAMLRTRDPLPQMNSLLASLHNREARETLQIYAAIAPEDSQLSPLATIGPIPDAVELDRVRTLLAQLQRRDEGSATYRSDIGSITAYAARESDERLLGALVVHRPARTASLLPSRRFVQAASELEPLLRDFRAIAVTQSAANRDPLTRLPNRRAILTHLRAHLDRRGEPCAVLILDIDHFKTINDTLGHQAGDKVLRGVAQIIARNIRAHDRAGRIGGEEFVVTMPGTSSEMARAAGERLRAAIENGGYTYTDGKPLTASIGVAVAGPDDSIDSLLGRADRALYTAKRQGRNRVVELGA